MGQVSLAYKTASIPDFAFALAHEVRNPLSNINLSVVMLKTPLEDTDHNNYLDIIMRSSVRINNLINELLTYQTNEQILAEKHTLHLLLNDVLELVSDRLLLKNIIVHKVYGCNDGEIVMERTKVKIALTNIIINAIEAMPYGTGELTITTKSIDGKYILTIEDNGCGISKAQMKHLFKPYYTNKPGGLGLGLSTTHNILTANNVAIHITSDIDKGTCCLLLFDKAPEASSLLQTIESK